MRNPFKVVRDWSVLREEKAGILEHIRRSGTLCGVSVALRDLSTAKDEREREHMRELNEITKTAASQLLFGPLADKYDLNDHGLSLSFVPKIVMERSVSKGMIDTFRERGGLHDAKSLAHFGFRAGELPDHVFRDLDTQALNGAPGDNVWEQEDRMREERRRARTSARKAAATSDSSPIVTGGGLVDASGAPLARASTEE